MVQRRPPQSSNGIPLGHREKGHWESKPSSDASTPVRSEPKDVASEPKEVPRPAVEEAEDAAAKRAALAEKRRKAEEEIKRLQDEEERLEKLEREEAARKRIEQDKKSEEKMRTEGSLPDRPVKPVEDDKAWQARRDEERKRMDEERQKKDEERGGPRVDYPPRAPKSPPLDRPVSPVDGVSRVFKVWLKE